MSVHSVDPCIPNDSAGVDACPPLAAQADRHGHPVVQWHIDWHAFLLPGGVRAGTFRLMRAECRVLAGTFRLMRA